MNFFAGTHVSIMYKGIVQHIQTSMYYVLSYVYEALEGYMKIVPNYDQAPSSIGSDLKLVPIVLWPLASSTMIESGRLLYMWCAIGMNRMITSNIHKDKF